MKTNFYIIVVILTLLSSCNLKKKSSAQNSSFGLYETVRIIDLPATLFDSIKVSNIKPQQDKGLPVIGYLTKEEFSKFQSTYSRSSIKLFRTVQPVDPEGKYYEVVAVRYPPVITNADLQKTKAEKQNVYLYFNYPGARKWAEMTKNNTGKMVAFVIDNLVYSIPLVNAEIKSGTAMINGFPDERSAFKISGTLNLSISR
jgi:preprotein translocase subunit SecD